MHVYYIYVGSAWKNNISNLRTVMFLMEIVYKSAIAVVLWNDGSA